MILMKAATRVSGIFFSVSNGDSTGLCNLSFETNLRKIDYAEVGKMMLTIMMMGMVFITMMKIMQIMMTMVEMVTMIIIKVSCDIMFSFTPGSSWFGLTDHSWSFYTDIGVIVRAVVVVVGGGGVVFVVVVVVGGGGGVVGVVVDDSLLLRLNGGDYNKDPLRPLIENIGAFKKC